MFLLYLILFVGGIYLMGIAFDAASFQGVLFVGGILLTSAAVGLPFILGGIEQRGDVRSGEDAHR